MEFGLIIVYTVVKQLKRGKTCVSIPAIKSYNNNKNILSMKKVFFKYVEVGWIKTAALK